MAIALITLSIEDSDADTSNVSVFVSVVGGDTVESLTDDYAHVFWDAVRPLITGRLTDVSVSIKPDISEWANNTHDTISDVQEKVIFTLRVCGHTRPVRLSLPTAMESIFEDAGRGKFVDVTNSAYVEFAHVLENGVVDDGIGMVDSHGNDICQVIFGEQFFGGR